MGHRCPHCLRIKRLRQSAADPRRIKNRGLFLSPDYTGSAGSGQTAAMYALDDPRFDAVRCSVYAPVDAAGCPACPLRRWPCTCAQRRAAARCMFLVLRMHGLLHTACALPDSLLRAGRRGPAARGCAACGDRL